MMYHYKHSLADSANPFLCVMIFIPKESRSMAKGKGGAPAPVKTTTTRNNGKASKKRPKVFDKEKRKLVVQQN
jgi:hypothetical protein